jgi:F0F1-type ATP synthase assembly protein I
LSARWTGKNTGTARAEQSPDPRETGTYFAMAQVGFEMVGCIILGLVLDYYLNWQPWGIIGGTLLGFGGGLYHLVILANKQEKARQRKGDSESK